MIQKNKKSPHHPKQNALPGLPKRSPGYFFFAIVRIKPSTIERDAAKRTLNWSGSKNVIVCAGIQNNGMVLPTTNFMNPAQSIEETTSPKEGRVFALTRESIQVSVMRCTAMKTGPKVRFMKAEI